MSVLRYRHLFVCIVLIAVLLSCTVMAGAEFTSSDSIVLNEIKSNSNLIYSLLVNNLIGNNGITGILTNMYSLLNGTYGIRTIHDLIKSIDTDSASIVTKLTGVQTSLSSINSSCSYLFFLDEIDQTLDDNLSDINSSTANIDTNTEGILTFLQDLNSMNWLFNTSSEFSWFSLTGLSLWEMCEGLRPYFDNHGLSDFTSASESNFTHFFMNFGSDIASNVSSSVGLFGGFQDFFSLPNVDISSTFEQVESGYSSWFSSGTAQALTVGAGSAAMTGISLMGEEEYVEPDTPYLDAWNAEVQEILVGGDGEW